MATKVGQIAIWVDDLDAAVRDYGEVFGIKFQIVEAEFINMRVAMSDAGLVLANKIRPDDDSAVQTVWNKPLLAMEIQVEDIEVTKAQLEAKGVRPIYYADAAGGMKEYFTDRFHGIPLTIFQMESESWLEATRGESEGDTVNVQWINNPLDD